MIAERVPVEARDHGHLAPREHPRDLVDHGDVAEPLAPVDPPEPCLSEADERDHASDEEMARVEAQVLARVRSLSTRGVRLHDDDFPLVAAG